MVTPPREQAALSRRQILNHQDRIEHRMLVIENLAARIRSWLTSPPPPPGFPNSVGSGGGPDCSGARAGSQGEASQDAACLCARTHSSGGSGWCPAGACTRSSSPEEGNHLVLHLCSRSWRSGFRRDWPCRPVQRRPHWRLAHLWDLPSWRRRSKHVGVLPGPGLARCPVQPLFHQRPACCVVLWPATCRAAGEPRLTATTAAPPSLATCVSPGPGMPETPRHRHLWILGRRPEQTPPCRLGVWFGRMAQTLASVGRWGFVAGRGLRCRPCGWSLSNWGQKNPQNPNYSQ